MHSLTVQSGCTRRRALADESRSRDALVPPAPIARAKSRDARVAHRKNQRQYTDAMFDAEGVQTARRKAVGPPSAAPVICSTLWHTPAAYETTPAAGANTHRTLQSYPIELSDQSGTESDTNSHQLPTVAPHTSTKQSINTATDAPRRQRRRSAAPKGQVKSISASAASGSDASLHQCAGGQPPQPPTAATAVTSNPRSYRAVSAITALLSMLVVLLAVTASNSSVHALLSSSSSVKVAGSYHSSSSAETPSTLAAHMPQPVSDLLSAMSCLLSAAHQTAGAHTWSAAAAAQPGSSSNSRELIRMSAVQGSQQVAGQWRHISGVSSRIKPALGLVTSMHSGSHSRSGTLDGSGATDISQSAPAAATGDAAAAAATAVTTAPADATEVEKPAAPAGAIQMYAVVDDTVVSPYKGATWGEVVSHISKRLQWSDERFNLNIITQQQLKDDMSVRDSLSQALSSGSAGLKATPVFVGIAVTDSEVIEHLKSATAKLPTALFWDSGEALNRSSRVDGFAPAAAGPVAQLLAQHVGFSGEARAANVLKTVDSLWSRYTSDDLLFIWLVLLNEYITPVPSVANTTKGTDLKSLYCMIKNCGQKIVDCVTDTTCKKGLDCLDGCAFNDQVCQYRCIVSYETPKFEQFALCILQLHNCRGLDAQIPMVPDPAPMTSWRGQPMTHEIGESLFIGWKEHGSQLPEGGALQPYSWLVAAGKNPAYDYFPCQHQLYSYGKGKGQMWYEPVFKAITLDGHEVWRRRRYRVRRGKTPGTFYYSVLDNGVTSNEYWRILDCAEDLTYCLFYYSGAAATAGLSYSGAVLGTVDGSWPEAYTDRIHSALRTAGIEPWELSSVDNSQCVGAPL